MTFGVNRYLFISWNNIIMTSVKGQFIILYEFLVGFPGVDITHPQSHKSYRPLTTLTYRWVDRICVLISTSYKYYIFNCFLYRWDYAIWGNNPLPFHLLNIVIHGLNCCLVYFFLKKCINSNDKTWKDLAFWASILFSVHPVHVEPLGGLVGRADLLAAFIFLAGFILAPEDVPWCPLVISFFAIFGSLFKENAIILSVI